MKMLKHLFGKRDKELDIMQEEAIQSPFRTIVRNFVSNKLSMGGLVVFLMIFLIVLIGPIFNPIDLSEQEETQINVAPGLKMLDVPDELAGNVKEISTGAACLPRLSAAALYDLYTILPSLQYFSAKPL